MGLGSWTHWIVIGIVALLLFGNRLPEVARSIGRAINEFKRGIREVNDETTDDTDTKPRGKLKPPAEDADDSDDDADRRDERVSRQRVKETTPSDS